MIDNAESYERLKRVRNHIKMMGYRPAFICLHGSQNYGLDIYSDTYQSDFDFKCAILPSLQDLVNEHKPTSKVVEFEGGQIDIKDIRVFIENITKMNPAYLECFLTSYHWEPLFTGDHNILQARLQTYGLFQERGLLFVKACAGMIMEKKKAMCHPYPTIVHKIKMHGYDGKQVHHIYRLLLMLRTFDMTGTVQLIPPENEREFLIDLKLNKYSLAEAEEMVMQWMDELTDLRLKLEDEYTVVKSDCAKRMITYSRQAIYEHCLNEGRNKFVDGKI